MTAGVYRGKDTETTAGGGDTGILPAAGPAWMVPKKLETDKTNQVKHGDYPLSGTQGTAALPDQVFDLKT
jgi:hypothetical protein